MASEKCTGRLEDVDSRRCAIGAALFAIGANQISWLTNLFVAWPWLETAPQMLCPDTDCPRCWRVRDVIWHLNDHHDWTREAIADWVATVEPVPAQSEIVPAEVSA